MTPEVVTILVVNICTTIIALAGLILKHVVDMQQYRATNGRVRQVQATLENGIKTSLDDTNEKVTALADTAAAQTEKTA